MAPSIKASCPGPEASPNHHTTPTMLDRWYNVLTVECSVWFSADIMGPMSSKRLTEVCQISPESNWMIIKTHGRMFYGQRIQKFRRHGSHYAWQKPNTAFHSKNLIPWFVDALLPQDLDNLPSQSPDLIPN